MVDNEELIEELESEIENDNEENDTTVVNVKVAFIRPEYDNLEEWMNDHNNVYIGRGSIVFINNERFPKKDSVWANTFKIDRDGTREEVIKKYEIKIREKIKKRELNIEELRGKNLGCWCKPEQCHGDVLLKILSEMIKKN